MKRYILLTPGIRNMGGAQMYVANKATYMESLGWIPDVYFFLQGDVVINYLQRFKQNIIPELEENIWSVLSTERERVIESISTNIAVTDEVVIESNSLLLTYWGEFIAERLKAKHLVFILQESIPNLTARQADFFNYKLDRKELLNSHSNTLHNIFKNYFRPSYQDYNYQLLPYCSNVLDYTQTKSPVNYDKADYNILSIGRLDKDYIKPMMEDIRCFANKYKDKIINLIFVGDDTKHIMSDYIKDFYLNTKNINLFLLGYIFPIPYDWIKDIDVSIASSNSVLVTSEVGIPTISIDAHDLKAIGVHQHTTNSTVLRKDDEPMLEIANLIEEILVNKRYAKQLKEKDIKSELGLYLSPHVELLKISSIDKQYYDILGIWPLHHRIALITKQYIIKIIRKFL